MINSKCVHIIFKIQKTKLYNSISLIFLFIKLRQSRVYSTIIQQTLQIKSKQKLGGGAIVNLGVLS